MEVKYNYLSEYIYNLQAKGQYTFSIDEIRAHFNFSNEAIKKSLNRLSRKEKIVSVRKGFYVIVPPEYASKKILPPALFIDQLMNYINKSYYVGLLSAAAMQGAAHQQPQEFQVITNTPALRQIRVKDLIIKFFSKSKFSEAGTEEKKTDTGYIKVSGPELTTIDLIQFEKPIGGINKVFNIIYELSEEINNEKFIGILDKNQVKNAYIQRLGYMFEKYLDNKNLANNLFESLASRRLFNVYLSQFINKDLTFLTSFQTHFCLVIR